MLFGGADLLLQGLRPHRLLAVRQALHAAKLRLQDIAVFLHETLFRLDGLAQRLDRFLQATGGEGGLGLRLQGLGLGLQGFGFEPAQTRIEAGNFTDIRVARENPAAFNQALGLHGPAELPHGARMVGLGQSRGFVFGFGGNGPQALRLNHMVTPPNGFQAGVFGGQGPARSQIIFLRLDGFSQQSDVRVGDERLVQPLLLEGGFQL